MALSLLSPLSPLLAPSPSSLSMAVGATPFFRLPSRKVSLGSRCVDTVRFHPITGRERTQQIVRASSEVDEAGAGAAAPEERPPGSPVSFENLPLESKQQMILEQRMKMKLAKKIRLRRKRLVRKRRMRKKGRWPPSKMSKNKNV